jgi:hypothetical protein
MDKASLSLIIAIVSLAVSIFSYWYSKALSNSEKRSNLLIQINIIIRRLKRTNCLLEECRSKCPKAEPEAAPLMGKIVDNIKGLEELYETIEKLGFFFPAHKLQMLVPDFLEISTDADDSLAGVNEIRGRVINCEICPLKLADSAS